MIKTSAGNFILKYKCFRFELMFRGEMKQSPQLSLELNRASSTQLLPHLNDFNKKYKQSLEDNDALRSLNVKLQTVSLYIKFKQFYFFQLS